MSRKIIFISFLILSTALCVYGQILNEFDVAAENFEYKIKNIETFIDRFNNQVDRKGNPVHQAEDLKNQGFRKERHNELVTVFDFRYLEECGPNEQNIIRNFVSDVVKEDRFMDYFGNDWFVEIQYKTKFKGNEEALTLVLYNYSPNRQASGWTISSFYFKPLELSYFTEEPNILLPPNSDGTMFINLKHTLHDKNEMNPFMQKKDELSRLLELIDTGELDLEYIKKIRFHFWQIKPYHIVVEYFNRNTANSGWLIADLQKE